MEAMSRIKKWCKICNKPQMDCICSRKRRKLKVYGYDYRNDTYYAAAYTKVQFARIMGSNLYTLGGCYVVDDPKLIASALRLPFTELVDWH